MPITRDDWLKAYHTATEPPLEDDPSVKSAIELRELWGVGRTAANTKIAALLRSGRLETTFKLMRRSSGALARIPAFRLLKDGAMARTQIDVEPAEDSLDGADVTDEAPDPADAEETGRLRANRRPRHSALPEVRGHESPRRRLSVSRRRRTRRTP